MQNYDNVVARRLLARILYNTVPYISKIVLSLSDVLMMAHINNLEKRDLSEIQRT